MMKSLVLSLSLLRLTRAWVPSSPVESALIPKDMIPKKEECSEIKRLSNQKATSNDSENYYFDVLSGALMHWPTGPAFVHKKKSALSMAPALEEVGNCVEEYYDITGDTLCWFSSKSFALEETSVVNEGSGHYFDDTGGRDWGDHEASTVGNIEQVGSSFEFDDEQAYYHW